MQANAHLHLRRRGRGGHLAAKLAAAGHEVCAVARGAHLAALQANGIALREGDRSDPGRLRAARERPMEVEAILAARKGLYFPP